MNKLNKIMNSKLNMKNYWKKKIKLILYYIQKIKKI